MIRYALKCSNDHGFESWFQSSGAYDALREGGHVACPSCGDQDIEKALMAPGVPAKARDAQTSMLSAPKDSLEAKLKALRAEVEAKADYVGKDFATEARAMHEGEKENRPIWGEAKLQDAKALVEDGIAVAPLPFLPSRKAH